MEHVDEGTIHAWLDGALPARDGEQLEAHIAGCATCAAAVAEARGLIAASSRILSALDDVPGGVIPRATVEGSARPASELAASELAASELAASKRAIRTSTASTPSTAAARPARESNRRPWYRRPQFAAAAGIAFVALTTTVLLQRGGVPSIDDGATAAAALRDAPMMQAESMADSTGRIAAASEAPTSDLATTTSAEATVPQAAAPTASAAKASAPTTTAPTTSAPEVSRREASSPAAPSIVANVAVPPTEAGGAATRSAPAPAPVPARSSMAKQAVARDAADQGRADSTVDAAAAVDRRSSAEERARTESVARRATSASAPRPSAPDVAAPPTRIGAARVADSAGIAKRSLALSADSITSAERRRVAGERDVQLQSVVTTGAGGQRLQSSAMSARAATPATLAGCYRLQPAASARPAALGDFGTLEAVELAFAAAGSDEARPAYVARDLASADARGVITGAGPLRWTLSTGGQVILVLGEGDARRRLPLVIAPSAGEALPAGALAAVRMDCPRR